MSEGPSESLLLRRSADAPSSSSPPAASSTTNDRDDDPNLSVTFETCKKRAMYSISDKVRVLKMVQDHTRRYPTQPLQSTLKALNILNIGCEITKSWLSTSDEIFAASKLGFGSRYRLSSEERMRVKEELLRANNEEEATESPSAAAAAAARAQTTTKIAAAKRKKGNGIAQRTTIEEAAGRKKMKDNDKQQILTQSNVSLDVITEAEEALLGAIIYRSSRTAKARREARTLFV